MDTISFLPNLSIDNRNLRINFKVAHNDLGYKILHVQHINLSSNDWVGCSYDELFEMRNQVEIMLFLARSIMRTEMLKHACFSMLNKKSFYESKYRYQLLNENVYSFSQLVIDQLYSIHHSIIQLESAFQIIIQAQTNLEMIKLFSLEVIQGESHRTYVDKTYTSAILKEFEPLYQRNMLRYSKLYFSNFNTPLYI